MQRLTQKNFFKKILLFLLMTIISGCANQQTVPPPPPATLPPATATKLPPTETPTPAPTMTLTPIPILSEEQARSELLDLLADNGGCRLPCLWGITPGESTAQEAQDILVPLSSIAISADFGSGDGFIAPWYTEGDTILSPTVGFNLGFPNDNQVVSYLTFHAREYKEIDTDLFPVYDSKTFGERLHQYMLPEILTDFGVPAYVTIQTYGEQVGIGGFEMLLLYPDDGLFVHYTTQMETKGSIAFGCFANAETELTLFPSGDPDTFLQHLSKTTWAVFARLEPINNTAWKSIDIATSMSIEEFYETYRQSTDVCIETPLEGWYIPEKP